MWDENTTDVNSNLQFIQFCLFSMQISTMTEVQTAKTFKHLKVFQFVTFKGGISFALQIILA